MGIANQDKKRVTLAQIAAEAGVSASTVAYVIHNKPNPWSIRESTREHVLATAAKLGYRPNAAARSLATGRSQAILMVGVNFGSYSWDTGIGEQLRGIESYLVPKEYATHVYTLDASSNMDAYRDIIMSGRVDGVIVAGTATPQLYSVLQKLYAIADKAGLPIVSLSDTMPNENKGVSINIDEKSGAEQATSHLIWHGHQRIALLGVIDAPWAISRECGYKSALIEAGLKTDENSIVLLEHHTQQLAYEATLQLAKSVEFTAMFAMSDALALAAILALRSVGRRVPGDCAVIGFDDQHTLTEYADPPLTSIHNPFYESGKTAAETIVKIIEGQPINPGILPVSLVIRESCGCSFPRSPLKK